MVIRVRDDEPGGRQGEHGDMTADLDPVEGSLLLNQMSAYLLAGDGDIQGIVDERWIEPRPLHICDEVGR